MYYDEIVEIRRLAGLAPLMEAPPSAKRLLSMFEAIIKIQPDLKPLILRKIEWARNVLKREDRIIYYLRLIQAVHLHDLTMHPVFGEKAQKKLNQIASKMGITENDLIDYAGSIGTFERQVNHYLSLPIDGIQRLIWDNQKPKDIISTFEQLESDWKEDQDRTVPHDPDIPTIIDFGDGYAWYDLETAYCSAEAAAMGHCGNAPRQDSYDNILSLRRKQQVGNEIILTPVLTFILDDNGLLGEMKGRGNDKPAERYHKYIIPLLLHDIVKGIKGGGYLAENNFSLNDLDDDVKEELIAEKPELEGPVAVIERMMMNGNYDRGIQAIESLIDSYNLDHERFDVEQNDGNWQYWSVDLMRWRDYESLVRDIDDAPVISLLNVLDEVEGIDLEVDHFINEIDSEIFMEIIEKLPHPQQDALITGTGQSYSNNVERYDALENAADIILQREGKSNRFYQYLMHAVSDALKENEKITSGSVDKIKTSILERLEEYAEAGYPARPSEAYIHAKDETDWKDGYWVASISLQDILAILESALSGDEYDDHNFSYLEWHADGIRVDADNWQEERGIYGNHSHLINHDTADPLAEDIEEKLAEINIENIVDSIAYEFAQRIHISESKKAKGLIEFFEESLHHDYEEIIRLSGIKT